ncbi:glycoside hydrolase family 99-like domain-containing protein [Chitinimonas sp.]|uniref:glycosyltransferase WbsX family protein n=1 Tax=Chitinimonas sp. TaxID=1934313 RepID=UPI002F948C47
MKSVGLLAFYLPQYHPIPENDEWWGKGFTEWTNVTRAKPNFDGHYQPHLPADLGFYDLRMDAARQAQAELAKQYGIDGFCYHYYWFGGKRLLEQPLEAMLAGGAPDIPFCLCWANENWTRRWDGGESEILMAQQHSPEDDVAMMEDVARYFADSRYIRIDGRPMLLVYRVDILPDPAGMVRRWRETCERLGLGNPYLCAVQSFGITDPTVYGFDAAVEFPPHGPFPRDMTTTLSGVVPGFGGHNFRYADTVKASSWSAEVPAYPRFGAVMPSWDNTARRRTNGRCYLDSHPLIYRAWLAGAIEQARNNPRLPQPFVFINAWNEWAEGCHLEPDQQYGHAWLEATRAARQGTAPQSLMTALLEGWRPKHGSVAVEASWQVVEATRQASLAEPPLEAETEQKVESAPLAAPRRSVRECLYETHATLNTNLATRPQWRPWQRRVAVWLLEIIMRVVYRLHRLTAGRS